MNSVLFLIETGPSIGLGHFYRCHSLATQFLNRFWRISYNLTNIQFKHDFPGVFIDLGQYSPVDFPTIIVCDGYNLDLSQISKTFPKSIIINFEDFHDGFGTLIPDIVINIAHLDGNETSSSTSSILNSKIRTQYLLSGTDFLPLRSPLSTIKRKPHEHPVFFIMPGATDVRGIIFPLLKKLLLKFPKSLFNIVTSSLNPMADFLISEMISDSRVFIFKDHLNLMEIMVDSDIAICGASTGSFEALLCGCKVISCLCVDNQLRLAKVLKDFASVVDCLDQKDIEFSINQIVEVSALIESKPFLRWSYSPEKSIDMIFQAIENIQKLKIANT